MGLTVREVRKVDGGDRCSAWPSRHTTETGGIPLARSSLPLTNVASGRDFGRLVEFIENRWFVGTTSGNSRVLGRCAASYTNTSDERSATNFPASEDNSELVDSDSVVQ